MQTLIDIAIPAADGATVVVDGVVTAARVAVVGLGVHDAVTADMGLVVVGCFTATASATSVDLRLDHSSTAHAVLTVVDLAATTSVRRVPVITYSSDIIGKYLTNSRQISVTGI